MSVGRQCLVGRVVPAADLDGEVGRLDQCSMCSVLPETYERATLRPMEKLKKAQELFIERMGLAAEAEGLPRIAGRLNGLFFLFGGPFSFSELAERLQISRGSVSTNVRMLRDLGIIELVTRPGDRQDYYQLVEQPFGSMLAGYLKRMEHMERIVREADDVLGASLPDARKRLTNMKRFYSAARESARELIDRLERGD